MKRLLLALLVAAPLSAQQPTTKVRYGIVDDRVRAMLASDWELHSRDQPEMERAYCLKWRYDWWGREAVYRVIDATPAVVDSATPSSISFRCERGGDVAELHTHPAQSCYPYGCARGGLYAWQCMPSDMDLAHLVFVDEPFGLVQCDRNALIVYLRPKP